jgi:hypothetical protein
LQRHEAGFEAYRDASASTQSVRNRLEEISGGSGGSPSPLRHSTLPCGTRRLRRLTKTTGMSLSLSRGGIVATSKSVRRAFSVQFSAVCLHACFIATGLLGSLHSLCIVTAMITGMLAPSLRCPTCRRNAERELERYCPECGGSPLEEYRLFARRCTSCHKRLSRGKRRNYRVRFCTNCGAYLDAEGV